MIEALEILKRLIQIASPYICLPFANVTQPQLLVPATGLKLFNALRNTLPRCRCH